MIANRPGNASQQDNGRVRVRSHYRNRSASQASLWSLLAIACLLLVGTPGRARAHPGSALEVGRDGRLYFVDTGSGVFTVNRAGVLGRVEGPAFHWFAIDGTSALADTPWPRIPGAEIVSAGRDPTLVLSSDFAVAVGGDGAFYYPEPDGESHWRMIRVTADGTRSQFARFPADKRPDGSTSSVNGLAPAPDGSLYFTHDRAVKKISARGIVTTIASGVTVKRCARIPGTEQATGPYLRGLDVAPNGTVFVAAAGCGAVLMIAADGKVRSVLRTASPWSPTAVAVSEGEIFVLEYLHTDSDDRSEWLPRVRKVSRGGAVETVIDRGTR